MGMAIEELYIKLFRLPLTQADSNKKYFAGFLQLRSQLKAPSMAGGGQRTPFKALPCAEVTVADTN